MKKLLVVVFFFFAINSSLKAQWKLLNNDLSKTKAKTIISHGNSLIVGTDGSGIFESKDNGVSWTPLNKGIIDPAVKTLTGSGTVNFLVSSGGVIYAATGNGVFISKDNGGLWTLKNTGALKGIYVSTLLVDGSVIYAGTKNRGIFISNNNGDDWVESNAGLLNKEILSFAKNGSTIYAGTYQGIFLTNDNGKSWTALNKEVTHQINGMVITDTTIYAATAYGVYRVTDNGTNWTIDTHGLPEYSSISFLQKINAALYCGSESGIYNLDYDYWTGVSSGYPNELEGFNQNAVTTSIASTETHLFIATTEGLFYNYIDLSYKKNIGYLQNHGTDVTKLTWTAPETGDYLLLINNNIGKGNYLFKNSFNVYYNYNFETKETVGPTQFDKSSINELFEALDKTAIETLKADIPLNGDITGYEEFLLIEYKKGEKISKICWSKNAEDETAKKLNEIYLRLGSFW